MSVAKHLYTAVNRFLDLDAMSFRSRPIFIAGESYAGKYVPVIGYYILKKNTDHDVTQKAQIYLFNFSDFLVSICLFLCMFFYPKLKSGIDLC